MDREDVMATVLAALPAASEAWPVPALFAWSFAVEPGTPAIVRLKAHLDAVPDAAQLDDLACADTDVAAQWWTEVETRLEVELVLWGRPPVVLPDGFVALRPQSSPAPQGPPYRIDWERQSRYLPPGHPKRRS